MVTWNELREAILKEIHILEHGLFTSASSFPDTLSPPPITAASFLTSTQEGNSKGGRQKSGYIKGNKATPVKKSVFITKKVTCTYCKGTHTAGNCQGL